MNPFADLFQSYLRWRHSRGFGVHSPFAYNLVTMAVNPGNYGYYGYDDIDRALLSPATMAYPRLRKDARLLLRVIVTLNSSRLLIYPAGQPVIDAVAKGAGIRFVEIKGEMPSISKGDMLVIRNHFLSPGKLMSALRGGSAVFAIDPDPDTVKEIYEACGTGTIFHGTRLMIAIPNEDMAFVAYTMKL